MDFDKTASFIHTWLTDQLVKTKLKGFVVGVSGGVDSGLVSTLCARTGEPTLCISMPINQAHDQKNRATMHMIWLAAQFKNVKTMTVDLTKTFNSFHDDNFCTDCFSELALSNTRSRLRMVNLYSYANSLGYLVVGTGNKVEDFGVGFFTKYGDGGIDISPIGDLMKSEVRGLAKHLGVSKEIYDAIPTDGLWGDNRSDEQQIGASYDELEWAMKNYSKFINLYGKENFECTERQKEVMEIYRKRHECSRHKMAMPPVCEIPVAYKS